MQSKNNCTSLNKIFFMKYSIESTLLKYGVAACRDAFGMHIKGAGGSTVGIEFGSVSMSDPELRGLGDRLIDAGRWLHENI